MSTNKNNAAQTLFRFVSLRAPQQSDEKDQNKRFILAPKELKTDNHFYVPVTTGSGNKQRLLKDQANLFEPTGLLISKENPSLNTETLKNDFAAIYDFAKWIARNKNSYTFDELNNRRESIYASQYSSPDKLLLWNNLIYQIVTQKDFYIKELVMQLLLAIHVLENSATTAEEAQILLNARIVLPKNLMIDDEAAPISIQATRNAQESTFPTKEMKMTQNMSKASATLQQLESLKKDISKMQKKYDNEYQAEYKRQEEQYKQEVAPIIAEYEARVQEAKRAFCEIKNPNVEYNPNDPCHQPAEVPAPILPKFEVNFRPEIEASAMIEYLKEESVETLLQILQYEVPLDFDLKSLNEILWSDIRTLFNEISTFQNLQESIAESVEKNQKMLSENVLSAENTYKSVGGVMIPMGRGTVPFTYQICPNQLGRFTSYNLALDVPDASWEVVAMSYTLLDHTNNTGFPSANYFEQTRSGNTIYLNKILASTTTNGLTLIDIPHTLNMHITFTNGEVATISVIIGLKSCVSGGFELENNEGEVTEVETNFIPKGFGFRQIGIADYLKVEQTTHAYVPGEVAHIENVMAREYRQKSTRRFRKSEKYHYFF